MVCARRRMAGPKIPAVLAPELSLFRSSDPSAGKDGSGQLPETGVELADLPGPDPT